MVRPMIFLHWRQIRAVLALFAVAAFALPLLMVQGLGAPPGAEGVSVDAYRMVTGSQTWLPLYPVLAAAIGVTLGLSSWNWDHQLGHVYALSLPLTRWEYVLNKLGAGVALALVPALAMWIGAHVAAASISLPTGLNAYPDELAVRFLLATILAYAFWFALAAGTIRTALWVTGSMLAFVVVGYAFNGLLVESFDVLERTNVVEIAVRWLLRAPGPLEIFVGNWSLIDV